MITVSPRVVVLISGVAAALGVVGCSSSTSRAASTTAFPVVSTSPMSSTVSTSIPGSATTSPAMTAAPTSAAPGTMPPSLSVLQTATTAPPTTVVSITIAVTAPTVDPGAPPDTITKNINEVTAAVQLAFDNFNACFVSPTNCDPASVYAPNSPALADLRVFITSAVSSGQHLSPDFRGSYGIIEAISFPTESSASATLCIYDAGTILGPKDGAGSPTVVNDSISSSRSQDTLILVGDRWLVSETATLEDLGEGNRCPAAHS